MQFISVQPLSVVVLELGLGPDHHSKGLGLKGIFIRSWTGWTRKF